ncbi:hypothetical protein D3C72_1346220 [compost metagenome]
MSGKVSCSDATPCVLLLMVTLRTFCEISCELGTITVERSPSWISVARTLMRRMSPSTPARLTMSPTLTGRSVSRIRPETKFFTISCRPKPIPTDSALTIHARLSQRTPSSDSTSSTSNT